MLITKIYCIKEKLVFSWKLTVNYKNNLFVIFRNAIKMLISYKTKIICYVQKQSSCKHVILILHIDHAKMFEQACAFCGKVILIKASITVKH